LRILLIGVYSSLFPFMGSDNQCTFFEKALEAPDDGLSIEVAIEPFIESSLEVEEKEHQFASL